MGIKEFSGPRRKELSIFVADNGKGIDESEYEKIFERFYSNRPAAQSNTTALTGHTGLGLSIVKSIVDACEGKITVSRSPTLGGAEFSIQLPV